jgi:molybdopterin-containing oxidoreductase family membrane subunit
MTKRVLYILGGLALLIGVWGVYDRMAFGHSHAAYGSYVVWGLWVAMYLFFAGCAAGAFMIAAADLLFGVRMMKGTGRAALWGALVSLGAALLSIWFDLGHMDRIWKVYLQGNPGSVMWQMVWGYTLFGLLILISLWLVIKRPASRLIKPLMWLGLLVSLFVSGAVGALIGVQAARPFWHVGLFPVQFPVFSLASGAALMLLVLGWFGPRDDPNRPQQLRSLGVLSIVLLVVKLYFMWSDYSQSMYGGVPMNVEAVREVLFGTYWWAFWILQIIVGALIPIVVLVQPNLAKHNGIAGWMGLALLVGYAVARGLILFPALTIPEINELANAFTGSHLQFTYFPSAMEWAVTIGVIGLATLAFLLGADRMPLFRAPSQEAV